MPLPVFPGPSLVCGGIEPRRVTLTRGMSLSHDGSQRVQRGARIPRSGQDLAECFRCDMKLKAGAPALWVNRQTLSASKELIASGRGGGVEILINNAELLLVWHVRSRHQRSDQEKV